MTISTYKLCYQGTATLDNRVAICYNKIWWVAGDGYIRRQIQCPRRVLCWVIRSHLCYCHVAMLTSQAVLKDKTKLWSLLQVIGYLYREHLRNLSRLPNGYNCCLLSPKTKHGQIHFKKRIKSIILLPGGQVWLYPWST